MNNKPLKRTNISISNQMTHMLTNKELQRIVDAFIVCEAVQSWEDDHTLYKTLDEAVADIADLYKKWDLNDWISFFTSKTQRNRR